MKKTVIFILFTFQNLFCQNNTNDVCVFQDVTLQEIVKPKYEDTKTFSEGLCPVKLNGKWGFIDKNGDLIISAKYLECADFSEGICGVNLNGKWGYIDKKGTEVIASKFENADNFNGGYSVVKLNYKWCVIDKTGITKIELLYNEVKSFKEGLLAVKSNNKWGFINYNGEIVIDIKYDDVKDFNEGITEFKINKKWGLMDKKGKEILSPTYDEIKKIGDGLFPAKLNNKWGYIDVSGNIFFPFKYQEATTFCKNFAVVVFGGELYFLNKKTKEEKKSIKSYGGTAEFTEDILPVEVITLSNKSTWGFVGIQRKITLKAKLLAKFNNKEVPIQQTNVYLITSKNDTLSKAKTNNDGEFELTTSRNMNECKIKISDSKKYNDISIINSQGQVISKLKKTNDGFEYKLLEVDIFRLKDLETNEDISLTLTKFNGSTDKDIKITENISYANASFTLDNNSQPTLDKVIIILKENPNVKVEIISHTDSQGDDKSNLLLSEKRATAVLEYLVSKGIDKTRLKATGKGESDIRNRCLNSIDCSDKEHEYNRRTEFSFTKG